MSASRSSRFFVLASSLTVAPSALAHGIDEGTYVLGDNVPHLVELAKALRVSTDELLGVRPVRETLSANTARLPKRRRRVEELRPAKQRARLKLVDAMLETHRRSTPPPPVRKGKAS